MANLLDGDVHALYPDKYNEKASRNSTMEIETQSLTACEVTPDGGAVSHGFVTESKPATISAPFKPH